MHSASLEMERKNDDILKKCTQYNFGDEKKTKREKSLTEKKTAKALTLWHFYSFLLIKYKYRKRS